MGTSSKQRKSSAADSGGATEMTDDMMGSDSALNASTPLQTSAGGSQGGSAGGVPGEGSAQVPSGITHYPVAHVTHQQLCANSQLFFKTLLSLLNTLGLTLKVPKIGGQEIDLHLLYREVTRAGGLQAVMVQKLFVQVCEPFNFPASFTNKSFVMRKLYCNVLHHFEQLYFHRNDGCPLVPIPVSEHHQAQRTTRGASPAKRTSGGSRSKSTPSKSQHGPHHAGGHGTPRATASNGNGHAAAPGTPSTFPQHPAKSAVGTLLHANGQSPMQSPSGKRKQSDSTSSPMPSHHQAMHHLAGGGHLGALPPVGGMAAAAAAAAMASSAPPGMGGGAYGTGLPLGFKPLLMATKGAVGGAGGRLSGTGAGPAAAGVPGGGDAMHASPTTSCTSGTPQMAPPVLAPPGLEAGTEFPCKVTAVYDNFYIISMHVPGLATPMLGQLMIALPHGMSLAHNVLPHQLIYEPRPASKKGSAARNGGGGAPMPHPLGAGAMPFPPPPHHLGMGPGRHPHPAFLHPGHPMMPPMPPFPHGGAGADAAFHHPHAPHGSPGGGADGAPIFHPAAILPHLPGRAGAGPPHHLAQHAPPRGGTASLHSGRGPAPPALDVDELASLDASFPDDLIALEHITRDWEPYPPLDPAGAHFDLGLCSPGLVPSSEPLGDATAAVTAQYSPGAHPEGSKKLRLRSNGGYAVVGGSGQGGGAGVGDGGAWQAAPSAGLRAGQPHPRELVGGGTPTALLDSRAATGAEPPEFLVGGVVHGVGVGADVLGGGEEDEGTALGGGGGAAEVGSSVAGKASEGAGVQGSNGALLLAGQERGSGGAGADGAVVASPRVGGGNNNNNNSNSNNNGGGGAAVVRSPFSCFVASLMANEAAVVQQHGGRPMHEVAAELWEGMSAEEKLPYHAAAAVRRTGTAAAAAAPQSPLQTMPSMATHLSGLMLSTPRATGGAAHPGAAALDAAQQQQHNMSPHAHLAQGQRMFFHTPA